MGIGLLVVALAVTAAVALPMVTQAQTATQTPATPTQGRGGPGDFGKMGADGQYLAQALGITQDQLTAAQQKAQTAATDQALAQGLITQAQADALKNGTGLGKGRGGMLGGLLALGNGKIDMNALLAQALNITTDQLTAAQSKAQDLALAAEVTAGRLTQEQADLIKAREAFETYLAKEGVYAGILNQAVQAGAITQAQADALLKAQQSGGFGFGRHGFGGMEGFGGGHDMRGGMHGGMRGGPWQGNGTQGNGTQGNGTPSTGGNF